ncbi:GNAT family N-acetyltransferase [bacterium]|nr:GNAT family N-acetyltransferase [bacterium]
MRRVAVDGKGWPVEDYIEVYESVSSLWVVQHRANVIGAVLIIGGPRDRFPIRSFEGWPDLEFPPGTSAEIPFVVVDQQYRGSGASFALCAACHWYFVKHNIDYIDVPLLRFYERHGMRMERVCAGRGGGEGSLG